MSRYPKQTQERDPKITAKKREFLISTIECATEDAMDAVHDMILECDFLVRCDSCNALRTREEVIGADDIDGNYCDTDCLNEARQPSVAEEAAADYRADIIRGLGK